MIFTMKSYIFVIFYCLCGIQLLAQQKLEVGYCVNGNATISKMIPSQQAGGTTYELPFSVNALSHRIDVGWKPSSKHAFYVSAEYGGIGPKWKFYSYPDKYTYDNPTIKVVTITDGSTDTLTSDDRSLLSYQGEESHTVLSLKCFLTHKYTWLEQKRLRHASLARIGWMQVVHKSNSNISYHQKWWSNDRSNTPYFGGEITGVEGLDTVSSYFRTSPETLQFYDELPWSILVSLGYELSYKLSNSININAQIAYNQSLRPMMRWYQMREYSESATGYSEREIQWFTSKLSHISFSIGASYLLGKSNDQK